MAYRSWIFPITLILLICSIGLGMQYSAAGGQIKPWMMGQSIRMGIGLVILFCVSRIDLRVWFRWSYAFYFTSLVFLISVELLGFIGMGAKRWIKMGFFNIQPSEMMRVTLILALSRYFHVLPFEKARQTKSLIIPLLMVIVPVVFVLRQPDLGTAILLLVSSNTIFFLAGVQVWKFICVLGLSGASLPLLWKFLHSYQKKRILVFLNPGEDPLGAGYHVLQSKIALGSGGVFGKGFLQGSQSHLDFLPEKQTDFVFAMFGEEFGFIGCITLISLYSLLTFYNMSLATSSRSPFGRFMAMGLTTTFFIYVFVNIGMVSGLLPVVGIPLPFMSYGGTALITLLLTQGLIFSVQGYEGKRIGRP